MTPFDPNVPLLITEKDFILFKFDWEEQVGTNTDLNRYFKRNGMRINMVRFPIQSIHRLLSTTGIKQIMAKFALCPGHLVNIDQEKIFTIILYGTDVQGADTSAYYMGIPTVIEDIVPNPVTAVNDEPEDNGFVPYYLASRWIDNWLDHKSIILNNLFSTRYGFLKGYTYNMLDFLNSMYPNGLIKDRELLMHFALHDHYSLGATDPDDVQNTFGMVLRGNTFLLPDLSGKSKPIVTGDGDDGNQYFDLSAPCPPTC